MSKKNFSICRVIKIIFELVLDFFGRVFYFVEKILRGEKILKQKLELNWIGKNNPPNVEPRILLHEKNFDYGDTNSENILIHGDNLLALKSLEQNFAGKIKCVYIDPPYNTGAAFEHYDDNLEHSIWLNLMAARLKILKNLLRDDGSIFIQIDNNEMAYLKVLCDEIFGRQNFVNDIIWKRRGGSANPNNRLNNVTDFILWYSKSQNYEIYPVYTKDDENTQAYIEERFKNEFNGERYMLAPVERNAKLGMRETMRYEYNGYIPKWGWMMSRENLEKLDKENRLHWNSKGRPNRRVFLKDYKGQPVGNLWTDIFVINPMSNERLDFDGQKPEALIERILTLATNPGEIVLDSFLGSGTTAAVAHKMGRRWIGIELEKTCYTHCIPRLKKVIDGEQGGISKNVGWQGGGGFKFFELAPTLIVKDKFGMEIINPKYDAEMLTAAVAKHNGFIFMPDENIFWKQGKSQENSYIYTTTNYLTTKYLDEIAREMRDFENLLICAPAFDVGLNERYENISVKKIPQSLLKKCEYDVESYDLKIGGGNE